MRLEEMLEALKKFTELKKKERRMKFGVRNGQSILLDFIFRNECFSHFKLKNELARRLRNEGRKVITEKELVFNGIKMRPDVCFFENGKWKFFEIEHNGGHKNNIVRNKEMFSGFADIQIIDAPKTKFCLL